MAPQSRFSRLNLTAIFFLFLSLLNITIAAPLPEDNVNATLTARTAQKLITQAEYEKYLLDHFKDTDKYLFYSGESEDQVKAFKAKNPGYLYYDDLFNDGGSTSHPWHQTFNPDKKAEPDRLDDGEASSKAMASVVTKQILVFGAAEYQQEIGKKSFYTRQEAEILLGRVASGKASSVDHMVKGTTDPKKVMVKQDGSGKFTWQPGYKEGDKNASGGYGVCKRAPGGCDAPKLTAKAKSGPKL